MRWLESVTSRSQTKGVASVAVDLAVGQALIFYKDGEASDDTLKGLVFDMGVDVKVGTARVPP